MRKRPTAPAGRIRSSGLRVSRGAWTVYVACSAQPEGRLIVALGRTAGNAVTRSRVRRIARDVFAPLRAAKTAIDALVMARDEVQGVSRRDVRNSLQGLLARGADAITIRRPSKEQMVGQDR